MPHFSQPIDSRDIDRLPLGVSPGSQLKSNDRDATSLANSMISLPASPSPIPTDMASNTVVDSSGGPIINPTAFEVSAVPVDMHVDSSETLEDNESNHCLLRQPAPLSIENKGTSIKPDTSRALGSLARFMDTRGISRSESQFGSRHFIKGSLETNQVGESPSSTPTPDDSVPVRSFKTPSIVDSQTNTPAPGVPTANLVLFLSTMLLKTHLDLIKKLENLADPPRLIFRDYDPLLKSLEDLSFLPPDYRLQLPEEADIIIAPDTGVMLTSIQALTQLYLPAQDLRFPGLGRFNGPVLTRIMTLSKQYRYLYVLVFHHEAKDENGTRELDHPSKEAIASLTIWCGILSRFTNSIPIIVASPGKLANTLVSLAHNHISLLPPRTAPTLPSVMNPVVKPRIPPIHLLITEHETRWELFLRMLGLNPFAARLVLGILEARNQVGVTGPEVPGESKASALCAFLEMSSAEMVSEFEELVGEKAMQRVLRTLRMVVPCTRHPWDSILS